MLEQKLLAQKTHAKKMRLTWEITTSRYLHFLGELTMRSLTYLELTFTAQMKSSFQTVRFRIFIQFTNKILAL